MVTTSERTVFLDSSGIFAVVGADDAAHKRSFETYILTPRFICHTAILLEAFSLICKRVNNSAAVTVIQSIRASPKIETLQIEYELIEAAWQRCLNYKDKEWDWIDCISFELMIRRGIRSALTLDHHFRQAGFDLL